METEIRRDMVWLDVETVIERDIKRAVQASRRADVNLWISGYYAARIYGRYQVDATQAIADAGGKSISSVRNWANAWRMYERLRRFADVCELRALRRQLTPSHFWTAYELQIRYGLQDVQVLEYLWQMVRYKGEGESHSVEALEREVDADKKKGGVTWAWYAPRVRSLYASLLVVEDKPAAVVAWLNAAPDEVRKP